MGAAALVPGLISSEHFCLGALHHGACRRGRGSGIKAKCKSLNNGPAPGRGQGGGGAAAGVSRCNCLPVAGTAQGYSKTGSYAVKVNIGKNEN